MGWVIAVLVIAVLGIGAAIAVGKVGEMKTEPVTDLFRQDLPDRPLTAADLQQVRFGITVRGYAMQQVDDLLDRLAEEISDRDTLIAQLTGPADRPAETSHSGSDQPESGQPESEQADSEHAAGEESEEPTAEPLGQESGDREQVNDGSVGLR